MGEQEQWLNKAVFNQVSLHQNQSNYSRQSQRTQPIQKANQIPPKVISCSGHEARETHGFGFN